MQRVHVVETPTGAVDPRKGSQPGASPSVRGSGRRPVSAADLRPAVSRLARSPWAS